MSVLRRGFCVSTLGLALGLCLALAGACHAPVPVPAALPLPQARHGHRVEAVAAGLLAFGGFAPRAGADAGRQTFLLAPGDSQWQPRAAMNRSRSFFASVVIDDVVHAVGDGVERYDVAEDRWVEIAAPGQLPRSHFAAAAIEHEIFVLGGYPIERSGFWIVDTRSGAIAAGIPPPGFHPGDHFHFIAALDGALHVVGGLDVATFEPKREHWVLVQAEKQHPAWRAMSPAPAGMWAKFGGGVVHGEQWLLFGDFGGHCFTAASGWRPCSGWEGLVAMPALTSIAGEVAAFGGMPVGEPRVPRVRVYDVAADRWRVIDK